MSEADYKPTFSAHTVPEGTAPKENLFQPNPEETVPGQTTEMSGRSHGKESTHTTASSTLGGATSGDVHKGMGKPAVGQTSAELRHEGDPHRKHHGSGLTGVGASGQGTNIDSRRLETERLEEVSGSHKRVDPSQKGPSLQDKGVAAEDKQPASAESIASETQKHGGKPATSS